MSSDLATQLQRAAHYDPDISDRVRGLLLAAVDALPGAVAARDIQTLCDLMQLVANPMKATELANKLAAAQADAVKHADTARRAIAELQAARASFEGERADHQKKLDADRAQHDAEISRRKREIDQRAAQVEAAMQKARADADAAAALRKDLDRRLSLLQEVAR
jgi:hypothetical protein